MSATATPKRRQAAVVFVLITLAIDALGIGLVIPIVPRLVEQLTGQGPSTAVLAVGPLVATFALAQLVAAPILGALSDCYGRRPIILGSVAGLGLNYLLLAWAPTLAWLYVGRVIAGATSANFSSASAYIADVSTPAERARRFGLVGATFSFGFVIGPAMGGVLGDINLRLPFLIAAALALVNVAYGVFVLPESLPPERRQPFAWRGANPVAAIRTLVADAVLGRLALAWAGLWFGLNALQATFVLSNGYRFGWTGTQNGLALGLVGVTGAVVQGLLVRRAVTRFGERRAAMLGFAISSLAYLLIATAGAGWVIYVAIVVQAFGGIANPSVRALVSARAGPERQGRAMGALSVVEGLTSITAPLIAAFLFYSCSGEGAWLAFPGAPFLAGSVVYLFAAAAVRSVPPAALIRAEA